MATIIAPRRIPRVIERAKWPIRAHTTRRSVATAAALEHSDPAPYTPDAVPPSPPVSQPARRKRTLNAKPFSDFLTDTHSRQHDYLRISVTERCNLRCLYCMPEEGVQLSQARTQLTSAEIFYLSQLFVDQGVTKIRLTGGEPTVRKDIVPLMQRIGGLRSNGLKELALTTNGISLHRKLDAMVESGLTGVNISLDTLDPFQFQLLTRRSGFEAVMRSINRVQEMNKLGAGVKLKINCVVMRGLNDHQILPFVEMTREQDVEVRFIEYMPFGGNKWSENKMLPYQEMLDIIRTKYPTVARMKDARNDTSKTWAVPGFAGRVGFITSMTHNFCGTCNRLRITSDGNLKVCLHGEAEVSLRDLLRTERNGEPMDEEAFEAIRQLELDRRRAPSLVFDGEEGWMTKEQKLLEVIGTAVKRKKAKHAGMGNLENMKNRPMILIGETRKHQSMLSSQYSSSPPWSRIPTHLLTKHPIQTQIRYFSSNLPRQEENGDDKPAKKASGLASAFGFQSLSGLFQQSPRGRYSRPKEPENPPPLVVNGSNSERNKMTVAKAQENSFGSSPPEAVQPLPPSSDRLPSPDAAALSNTSTSGDMMQNQDAALTQGIVTSTTDDSRAAKSLVRTYSVKPGFHSSKKVVRATYPSSASAQIEGSEDPGSDRSGGPGSTFSSWSTRRDRLRKSRYDVTAAGTRQLRGPKSEPQATSAARKQALQLRYTTDRFGNATSRTGSKYLPVRAKVVENPWQGNGSAGTVAEGAQASGKDVERPWGISQEDMQTIETLTDPQAFSASEDFESNEARREATEYAPPLARSKTRPATKQTPASRLTHVTSSGEAHMVDVGAKPSSRRVAIASAYVRFNNSQPFQLIFENNNKKGDVLGVARIAGIMAAKNTSSLIPLCHPIVISKVEVDLRLVAPNEDYTSSGIPRHQNRHGAVSVQAVVETVGPTGVEMEALTAASGAALTVYDMCKAVDRAMEIAETKLQYKSGGKSGMYCQHNWGRRVGRQFFVDKGLDVPIFPSTNTGAKNEQSGDN